LVENSAVGGIDKGGDKGGRYNEPKRKDITMETVARVKDLQVGDVFRLGEVGTMFLVEYIDEAFVHYKYTGITGKKKNGHWYEIGKNSNRFIIKITDETT
jgi:hypothetical protein